MILEQESPVLLRHHIGPHTGMCSCKDAGVRGRLRAFGRWAVEGWESAGWAGAGIVKGTVDIFFSGAGTAQRRRMLPSGNSFGLVTEDRLPARQVCTLCGLSLYGSSCNGGSVGNDGDITPGGGDIIG